MKYIKIFKQESNQPLQNQSISESNQVKDLKSLFIPRNQLDEIIPVITSLEKRCRKIKSLLTQRKIKKSQFDLHRIKTNFDEVNKRLESYTRYIEKSSVLPKKKDDVLKSEVDSSDTKTS